MRCDNGHILILFNWSYFPCCVVANDCRLTDRGVVKLQEGIRSLLDVREGSGAGTSARKPVQPKMLLQ